MAKNIYKTGDQFAEPGTTPWADWQRSRLKHALKDVHFEARSIVGVIRDMCEGEQPAWHLMTRPNGVGFRTFEEFVTSPDGIQYSDYTKFKSVALSEPGIMNAREFDLLTVRDDWRKYNNNKEISNSSPKGENYTKTEQRLHAINRAPKLIQKLYRDGLINVHLAPLLGPDPAQPHAAERQRKADRALDAIQALSHTGDDAAYRRAVNDAVRRAFLSGNGHKASGKVRHTLPKDPAKLITLARQEYGEAYLAALRQALLAEDTSHV